MPTDHGRTRAALLMLADGRFPAGGYAHSGMLEATVAAGGVRTVADLELFVTGRLRTSGLVAATFAAAACAAHAGGAGAADGHAVSRDLDAELEARTPSPAQRRTSRALGRQLLRAISAIAPDVRLEELGTAPHHPIALGGVYAALGLTPRDAALACLHEAAAAPVSAAARLLSLDPFDAHGVLSRAGTLIDTLAEEAVERSARPHDLPAHTGPLLDVNAERHAAVRTRLFAS